MKFLAILLLIGVALLGLLVTGCGGIMLVAARGVNWQVSLMLTVVVVAGVAMIGYSGRMMVRSWCNPTIHWDKDSRSILRAGATLVLGICVLQASVAGFVSFKVQLWSGHPGGAFAVGVAWALTLGSLMSGMVSSFRTMSVKAHTVSYGVALAHLVTLAVGVVAASRQLRDSSHTAPFVMAGVCLLLTVGHWLYWNRYKASAANSTIE